MSQRLLSDAEKIELLSKLEAAATTMYAREDIRRHNWEIIKRHTESEMATVKIYDGTFDDVCEQCVKNLINAKIDPGRTVGPDYAAVYISKLTQSTFKSFQTQKSGQTEQNAGARIDYINTIVKASGTPRHMRTNIHVIVSNTFNDICDFIRILLFTRIKDVVTTYEAVKIDATRLEQWQLQFMIDHGWQKRPMTMCLRVNIDPELSFIRGVLLTDIAAVITSEVKIGKLDLRVMWYDAEKMFVDVYCDENSVSALGSMKIAQMLSGVSPITKYLRQDVASIMLDLKLSGITELYDMWPQSVYIPDFIQSITDSTKEDATATQQANRAASSSIITFDDTALDQNGVYPAEVEAMLKALICANPKKLRDFQYVVDMKASMVEKRLKNESNVMLKTIVRKTEGNLVVLNKDLVDRLDLLVGNLAPLIAPPGITYEIIGKYRIRFSEPVDVSASTVKISMEARKKHWYLVARGSAYKLLEGMPFIDFRHVTTNDIRAVYSVLGSEGACKAIERELNACESDASKEITTLLAAVMTCKGELTPITKVGLIARNNGANISELLSSREPVNNITRFTAGGHLDTLTGIHGCIINGLLPEIGNNMPRTSSTLEYVERLLEKAARHIEAIAECDA